MKTSRYIDIGFEFLLPKECNLSHLGFTRQVFEWGGEFFPQDPEEAIVFGFKLIKIEIPDFMPQLLPKNYRKEDWQCIYISDGLGRIEEDYYFLEKEFDENKNLENLIREITNGLERWVVYFMPEHDRVDEILEGNAKKVYEKIQYSITKERIGFVISFEENA